VLLDEVNRKGHVLCRQDTQEESADNQHHKRWNDRQGAYNESAYGQIVVQLSNYHLRYFLVVSILNLGKSKQPSIPPIGSIPFISARAVSLAMVISYELKRIVRLEAPMMVRE
jgi:hypothetical protein